MSELFNRILEQEDSILSQADYVFERTKQRASQAVRYVNDLIDRSPYGQSPDLIRHEIFCLLSAVLDMRSTLDSLGKIYDNPIFMRENNSFQERVEDWSSEIRCEIHGLVSRFNYSAPETREETFQLVKDDVMACSRALLGQMEARATLADSCIKHLFDLKHVGIERGSPLEAGVEILRHFVAETLGDIEARDRAEWQAFSRQLYHMNEVRQAVFKRTL